MKYPILDKVLANSGEVFVVLWHHKHGVDCTVASTKIIAEEILKEYESQFDSDEEYAEIIQAPFRK